MQGMNRRTGLIGAAAMLLAVVLMLGGCSALRSKKGPATMDQPEKSATAKPKAQYYDFGDILLPIELKVDKENSFVFSTPGLTAGVLSLKGNVEINSLIAFFESKMPVDGWQVVSAFKAPRSMMLFKKQTRWCAISVTEARFSTRVEIWVAPTVAEAGTGLLR